MRKRIWTSIYRRRYYFFFCLILFAIGIASGIYFYTHQSDGILSNIGNTIAGFATKLESQKFNNAIPHILFMLIIFACAVTVILLPVSFFFLFFEGMSIGFGFFAFLSSFHVKGFFFACIYYLVGKGIYIVLLLFLLYEALSLSKCVLGFFLSHNDPVMKNYFIQHFKRYFFLFFAIFLSDVLLFFFGNRIMMAFKWLIS